MSKPILQKMPVTRDENGYWTHPDLERFWEVEMAGFRVSDAEHNPAGVYRAILAEIERIDRTNAEGEGK